MPRFDFGLAKLSGKSVSSRGETETLSGALNSQYLTSPGAMLGTVGIHVAGADQGERPGRPYGLFVFRTELCSTKSRQAGCLSTVRAQGKFVAAFFAMNPRRRRS